MPSQFLNKWLWIVCIATIVNTSDGAIIRSSSPSRIDVESAIDSSSNGDIIVIPPGLSYWTSNITRTVKSIAIIGSGTNRTDGTVIVDSNPTRTSTSTLFNFTYTNAGTGLFRLSNIRIEGETTNTITALSGFISMTSRSQAWRLDHINIATNAHARMFVLYSGKNSDGTPGRGGLIDHCYFDGNGQAGLVLQGGSTGLQDFGDDLWTNRLSDFSASTNAGIYIESCVFSNAVRRAATDAFYGAVFVFRHNLTYNADVETHEMGGRSRGPRWSLSYENDFWNTGASTIFSAFIRGGSGVHAHNNHHGVFQPPILVYFRQLVSYPGWGVADGTNSLDLNVAGGPFETGTHTGTTGTLVLSDSTKAWSINKWTNYTVLSLDNGDTNRNFGLVQSSTANTISFLGSGGFNAIWTNGQHYAIYKVNQGMDCTGCGAGDLMAGPGPNAPTNTVLGGLTYPRHLPEPYSIYGNTNMVDDASPSVYALIPGRNYTNTDQGLTFLAYPHPLNINSVIISPALVGVSPSGTQTFTPSSGSGQYLFELLVNNSGGSVTTGGLYTAGPSSGVTDTVRLWDSFGNLADATIQVGTNQPPSITSFTASPNPITYGSSSTISWTTTGATAVMFNGTPVTANSSTNVSPASATTYTLIASNAYGSTTNSVTVSLIPSASFTATPATISFGNSSSLVWHTTNATSITLDGVPVSAHGTNSVSPASTTVYSLLSTNASGSTNATQTVTVTGLPPRNLILRSMILITP